MVFIKTCKKLFAYIYISAFDYLSKKMSVLIMEFQVDVSPLALFLLNN